MRGVKTENVTTDGSLVTKHLRRSHSSPLKTVYHDFFWVQTMCPQEGNWVGTGFVSHTPHSPSSLTGQKRETPKKTELVIGRRWIGPKRNYIYHRHRFSYPTVSPPLGATMYESGYGRSYRDSQSVGSPDWSMTVKERFRDVGSGGMTLYTPFNEFGRLGQRS